MMDVPPSPSMRQVARTATARYRRLRVHPPYTASLYSGDARRPVRGASDWRTKSGASCCGLVNLLGYGASSACWPAQALSRQTTRSLSVEHPVTLIRIMTFNVNGLTYTGPDASPEALANGWKQRAALNLQTLSAGSLT